MNPFLAWDSWYPGAPIYQSIRIGGMVIFAGPGPGPWSGLAPWPYD
jgi:hypothetical protein